MAGLSSASRSAITKILQEWREAFNEAEDCRRQLTDLSNRIYDLEVKEADAISRENIVLEKFNKIIESHSEDPIAVREINKIIEDNIQGIMGVHVVSGGLMEELSL